MRTLAVDGRMGASGDMLLGALLAAGADRDALAPVEAALPVTYEVDRVEKNGIAATSVDVLLTDAAGDAAGEGNDADDGREHDESHHDHDQHGHDHSHDHHGHDHSHNHDKSHSHVHEGDESERVHAEGHGPHRSYESVVDIVTSMDLPAGVGADAKSMFELLGEAEADVHGTDIDAVHFHEVGADDAIADVVGACLLLDDLDVDRVVTTPLSAGGGEVEMAHGTYPVPTPAVVGIAEAADWSLQGGPVEAELLTPTGAAILAHVATGVETLPPLRVESSGYGAGKWDFDERPNVIRAVVGEDDGGLERDAITVLETNLDDASPELLGGLQETLAPAGALDVSIVPLTMKKSRPGHLVKVICKPEDAQHVARRLAEETGTLGVREHGAGHRWIADRERETVTVTIAGERYDVQVKVASAGGDIYDVSAEYDDALAVTQETEVPVREVMRRAEAAARTE